NWMTGEVARLINAAGRGLSESLLQPQHVSDVVELVEDGTLTTSMAKEVFEATFETGTSPGDVVKERGMSQITDTAALEQAVHEALDANEAAVADYLNGKETAIRFLTGQVMKVTRGQANPQLVNQLLVEKLKERSDSR
ncbi:MAG: Asp-tRNA(Asn)/Glu-tRNA(Gln) amidotransferase GatCAB subunit B, partial [Chloroflexi bacterium]|nr:Asp-tRNA(Asn)/Glu-tRNA(Gln) amidotransferase GatCAB subunit B [Chloroflexota bacterium]